MTLLALPLTPAAVRGRRIVIVAVALLATAFLWAGTSEIEQNVRAQGQVIASARTQVVQSANDGVIEHFAVREGEAVRRGQLLVTLERNQAAAAQGDSLSKVAALKAQLVRLRAEVFQRPLDFPPEVRQHPSFVANQSELFNRRRQALHAELAALEHSRSLVQSELDVMQPLLQSGDVGKVEVIRLERQLAEFNGQIGNRRNKYFQDAQAEMTKAEEDLATQEQLLSERSTTLERTELHAPADGLVRKLAVTTPGARVRAGDTVLELLPTGSRLIVEAKLKPADRGFIREGQPVTVKLDAFDYAIYGTLPGRVSYLSPDALTEATKGGEQIYYQVQVVLDDTADHHGRIQIQPGMTTTVEIRTGTQTVLKYLTKPVTKTLSESLTER